MLHLKLEGVYRPKLDSCGGDLDFFLQCFNKDSRMHHFDTEAGMFPFLKKKPILQLDNNYMLV
jgi:hypothetical protein